MTATRRNDRPTDLDEPCFVAPSPELRARIDRDLDAIRGSASPVVARRLALRRKPRSLGLDDGVILPPEVFPFGTPAARIRRAAAERTPLRGTVRVLVVLVDFSDRPMTATAQRFRDLFFSEGVVPTGSVREYFRAVTHGLVTIEGEVVGPVRMSKPLAHYANGNSGMAPRGVSRLPGMARETAVAVNPTVDFGPYDNDGNGFVDAFIVVHAGRGAEETGSGNDIWSHKWTFDSVLAADGARVFAYLTVPEDAKLGVCAHELGHLLFGFPDLYDIDDSSEGVGNWCLMGSGSWNGSGDTPAHPSAWCKAQQGWVRVENVNRRGPITIRDVKDANVVYRLWRAAAGGPEYFLVENRQRSGYDAHLPGHGILVWHIDEGALDNSDEERYLVALVQADGAKDLELRRDRGDAGDPYPGAAGNRLFGRRSTPSSRSNTGLDTCVALADISDPGPVMTAKVQVRCPR